MHTAYIWDVDGTLARKGDREIYEYDKTHLDTPIEPVVNLYKHLRATTDAAFFIITGRSEGCRRVTEAWLEANGIDYDHLFMRPLEDTRKDMTIKEEFYNYRIMHEYKVLGVFDDRLRVCRMWYNAGLPVYRVGDPDSVF